MYLTAPNPIKYRQYKKRHNYLKNRQLHPKY